MTVSIREQMDLAGKVAVITGASRGIGAAIARGLAEFGATVVLSSRRQEGVDETAAELTGAGFQAAGIAAHVGDPEQLNALVNTVCDRYGGIDIVVNNAAVNPMFGPVAGADLGVLEKILTVNVKGPFELCRLAYPMMQARGGGAVINVSSIGGLRPEPMLGLYSVSKAALLSLTKVLAVEWAADGIRVNAICPGLVQTRFSAAIWQDEGILNSVLDRVPLGRLAQPEEIAPLAAFLAGNAAGYITGGVFTLDGGLTV